MSVHVVTARIYTGAIFSLGKVASGLLGRWCPNVADAEPFQDPSQADRVFDALVSYLSQPRAGRASFDPCVLSSLYERARVVELGVARVDEGDFIYNRRRALNLQAPVDPKMFYPARRPAAA